MKSKWEIVLLQLLKDEKIVTPIAQYRLFKNKGDRRWLCDLIWIDKKLIVEVEGGIWKKGKDGKQGGRHNRPQGFINDCEKYNEYTLMGYRVLRVTPEHITTGKALEWIKRGLTEN